MHRGYLIEALIGLDCAGKSSSYTAAQSVLPLHACLPIVLDRYLVVRNTAAALATAALIRKLAPKSRMGRIFTNAPIRGGQSGSKFGQATRDRRQPHSFPVLAQNTAVHAAI